MVESTAPGIGVVASAPVAIVRPDQRIPALDGIRACASLMVFFYHYSQHISQGSFRMYLERLPDIVWQGVDLFFVLSGFLIAGILFDCKESANYYRTFYIRRTFRIMPLYYVVLLSFVATVAIMGTRADNFGRLLDHRIPAIWFFLWLQNFAMVAYHGFGSTWLAGTWSLAVEEQFYLTLPAIIRNFSAKAVAILVAACFWGAMLLRAAIQKLHFEGLAGYLLLPTRVDSLATGVLIAMLVRYRPDLLAGREKLVRRGTLALLAAWIVYTILPNPQAIRLAFLAHTAHALIFGGFLLSAVLSPNTRLSRFLSFGWMRELGNMAYSTYMIHGIVLCTVFQWMRGMDPRLGMASDLVPLLIAFLASLALSWTSWNYFEKPLVKWGHRFHY